MKKKLYPLKFTPILKEKIWGGTKLSSLFGKQSGIDKIGESWELSGYRGVESVVNNGFLAGKNLTNLLEIYKEELVGKHVFSVYKLSFPLLFKLIDANDNLSIQVHPCDDIAAKRHNSFGKTEMWYAVDAEVGAELTIGFSKNCTREEYLLALEAGEVEGLLQKVPVFKGDVFFIPAGLVHAIGEGVVIAEIQQSSDITYRIYDYKRKDDSGNKRELHTDAALDVIDFSASKEPKILYRKISNQIIPLVECKCFTTNIIEFDKLVVRNYKSIDSFVVYMCLDGEFDIELAGERIVVNKGETILIPASIDEILLRPVDKCNLLEVYILQG